MVIKVLFFKLMLFHLIAIKIIACDCIDSISVSTSFAKSDVVFIGYIVKQVNISDIKYNTVTLGYSNVLIEKIYKGENFISESNEIPIFNFQSSCDYVFQQGEKYLIFGESPENGRFIFTDKCMGNLIISKVSSADFLFLEENKRDYNNCNESIEIKR